MTIEHLDVDMPQKIQQQLLMNKLDVEYYSEKLLLR
jgi:hypothetical protein